MLSEIAETQSVIASVVFGKQSDHRQCVKRVMVRDIGDSPVELWHALDVSDFSTFRSFVVPCGGDLYDVDFLSRHEIVPPMSIEKLPPGWKNWAAVHRNQLVVTDKAEFCCRMMTPDAAVALPTYRFEFLVEDVQSVWSGELLVQDVMEKVLESLVTGYSYKKYSMASPKAGPVLMFSLEGMVGSPVDTGRAI